MQDKIQTKLKLDQLQHLSCNPSRAAECHRYTQQPVSHRYFSKIESALVLMTRLLAKVPSGLET